MVLTGYSLSFGIPMKKFILILLLCSAIFPSVKAQKISGADLATIATPPRSYTVVDTARYRVFYKTYLTPDSLHQDEKYVIQTTLLIGDRASVFMDYNQLRYDSVYDALLRANASNLAFMGTLLPIGRDIIFQPIIVKNYPKKGIVTYQQSFAATMKLRYADGDVAPEWKLDTGSRVIQGFKCQRALCRFRGRDYVAWYAPEIAISEGPYVFSGLPGLILQLSDQDQNYIFLCEGFYKCPAKEFVYLNDDKVTQTDRAEYRKIERNSVIDPISVNPMLSKMKSEGQLPPVDLQPYNPIELE